MNSDFGLDAADSGADAEVDMLNLTNLTDNTLWQVSDAEVDPFDDRPETVDCPPDVGFGTEQLLDDLTLAVETDFCNYLTVQQPALVDSGDSIYVRFWHFGLTGEGDSHVAIATADGVVWERRIAIPSDAGLIEEEVSLAAPIQAGEPVFFHLHNHGENSYNLLQVGSIRP